LQFDLRNEFILEELELMNKRNAARDPDSPDIETVTHNDALLKLVVHEPYAKLNWNYLKARLARYGCRNATLTTIPPTESTAKRLGNLDMIEPPKSMITAQRTGNINQLFVYQPLLDCLKSIKKLSSKLNYEPKISLFDGLKQTFNWYSNNHY
ncbi:MAG: hypothetical protein KGL95_10055, partial [Patescibacteria group bacterium]|nr:hypothetical protein [Patescibacteria group bacterium]